MLLHRTTDPRERVARAMRPAKRPHPRWCHEGHVCSAERGGEHRSEPMGFDTEAGRIVVVRVQSRRGDNRLEIRAVVELPDDQDGARAVAMAVIDQVCRATITPAPAARR